MSTTSGGTRMYKLQFLDSLGKWFDSSSRRSRTKRPLMKRAKRWTAVNGLTYRVVEVQR